MDVVAGGAGITEPPTEIASTSRGLDACSLQYRRIERTMPTTAKPTAKDILAELEPLGSASYKRTMQRHGVRDPFYGVKIGDLKKIQKRVKKDHALALALFDTGIYDAMYLAGLIADEKQMTKRDLQRWLDNATSPPIAEFTVPWVAAESPHGRELGLTWIDSKDELVAVAGWNTLSGMVSHLPDTALDLGELERLLQRVAKSIHDQPNRVRYGMNSFVIAVGSYVEALSTKATAVAKKVGKLDVDLVGDCKLPDAAEHIDKAQQRGSLATKRKTVRC